MANQQITLYENLIACSYTPFYLAQTLGLFKDEGLDINLQLSPSPPETAQGLIDGRADVSFGGPMRVLMHHNIDDDCPLICFGQVVARDPFILIGQKPNSTFSFQDLIGPKIGIATDVPTPWMTLQDDLSRAGVDPDLINKSVDKTMQENTILFKKGELDVVQVFEPYAQELLESGGHVWHNFSTRGDIAFTTFYATRSFVDSNRFVCKSLINAINTSLTKIHESSAKEISDLIRPFYFPHLAPTSYENIINRYKESKLWPKTTALPATSFVRLKAALLSGDLIQKDIPYERIVDRELSEPR